MSTETVVHCDRCGAEITADRSLLRVETGALRTRRETIELCPACAESLTVWLKGDNR
jgi:hypothetical protein